MHVGDRIAGLVGTAYVGDTQLLPLLAQAMYASAATADVWPTFFTLAKTHLAAASAQWFEMYVTYDFLTVVIAGHDVNTSAITSFEVTSHKHPTIPDSVTFNIEALQPVAKRAYVGAYGVVDDELRCSCSAYMYEHAAESRTGRVMPAPRTIGELASAQELLTFCRTALDGMCAREPAIPRPAGFPLTAPLISAPVIAVSV